MSSNKSTQRQRMPFYSMVFSLRTLFLLIITGSALLFSSVLIWSGTGIMNVLIKQFSSEIMIEKLNSVIQPVEYRFSTLKRIGLEDSVPHKLEIRRDALADFSGFRYKETGTIFVISNAGKIIQSEDFSTEGDVGFTDFLKKLESGVATFSFSVHGKERYCAFQLYKPLGSYIGIAIDRTELFVYKDLFVKIVFMMLVAVLLGIVLFSSLLQRLLITPLIRLGQYANQIGKGNYDATLDGKYILELSSLKVDIQQMVTTLHHKMDQTSAQLQLISERERWLDEALAALQESEKKYRAIYNAPSDAILIYDPEKATIIDANRGMFDLFGYHHEEIASMGLGDLSGGDFPYTASEAEKMISITLEKGEQLIEWLARKKDGELFWIEMSLKATYLEGKRMVLAVMRNIHIRKMAQQDLASEKERLAVTLHSIGDGVIATDERGRIVLMNRVAENLTAWKQHEAVGRIFPEVFHILHQKTGERCPNPVDEVLATGQMVDLANDTVLVARDGSRRIVADSGAPIRDPQSVVIGSIIVFRDVTQEKKIEEELFKIRKLESVGVLAGGIAHDFNNILVGILGNISLAKQCLDDTEKAAAMLQSTEKAAIRAKDLTAQLLTFSRGGEPVLQTASIASAITESAEFALRGSNVKIVYTVPDDLWLVNADTGQISQVIQNIVLNARQAIPEEGKVEISCLNSTNYGDGPEQLREKCVRITISDNGWGIPEEVLDRIFDPYFTTKDDGSGLGLAICHSIIKKHNGMISVESEPGKGTTFSIQLPAAPEQKIDQQSEIATHSFFEHKAKILVMDDDPMILDLSKQMLEYLGHEVVVCEDGEKALEQYGQAMQLQRPFDLVIMDLTIPGGMGGEKAIQQLLSLDPDAKAIVSSGYSNDKVLAEYMNHGFKAVVVKPYQIEDLDKAVQEILMA